MHCGSPGWAVLHSHRLVRGKTQDGGNGTLSRGGGESNINSAETPVTRGDDSLPMRLSRDERQQPRFAEIQ